MTDLDGVNRVSTADEKHKLRKDIFALARLNYFQSLQSLAFFKEFSTLATLAHYVHAIHDICVASGRDLDGSSWALDDLDLGIDTLSAEIESRDNEWITKRNALESCLALQKPTNMGAQSHTRLARSSVDSTITLNRTAFCASLPSPDSPISSESRLNPFEILPSLRLRKKEGFLWANSRPITHLSNVNSVRNWRK